MVAAAIEVSMISGVWEVDGWREVSNYSYAEGSSVGEGGVRLAKVEVPCEC